MRYITQKVCWIEDRREEQFRNEPSVIVELVCTDCNENFLIVVAGSVVSDFTSVCARCWHKRRVLHLLGPGDTREVHLDPGEDVLEVLNKSKSRICAYLVNEDGTEQRWEKHEGKWEEV